MLLPTFIQLCSKWETAFSQKRTFIRALRHAVGNMYSIGRSTISRTLISNGRQELDWSGDYYFYSRSPWSTNDVFMPSIEETAALSYPDYIAVAWDEVKIKKTGRKIPDVSYQRDPLSPPFHTNFMLGHRYLHASALVPLHINQDVSCRGIPVGFSAVPYIKKPGKKASEEECREYEVKRKTTNLSTHFVHRLKEMRVFYDRVGAAAKTLVAVCDGSFCNNKVFTSHIERVILLTRCRKDLSLCLPAPRDSRRVYGEKKFSPESVRKDDSIKWKEVTIYHGKKRRVVAYKEVKNVLWQRGAKRKRLRLIVLRPVAYRTSKKGRMYYRQPAYLLCDDCSISIQLLIQMYFDRWQIEVNHREIKDTLGVGQAQVWSKKSVERQPAFVVACYSLLLLASMKAYGPTRNENYIPLPSWRKTSERPSCLDLITQLRREVIVDSDITSSLGIITNANRLIIGAAA